MPTKLVRSINEPIRECLTRAETWNSEDKGLIWCWELGRIFRSEGREIAAAAQRGELPLNDWKGGVTRKLEADTKSGSLQYLAQWQGMRGEDLDVDLDSKTVLTCSRFGQAVSFSATGSEED